MVSNQWVGRAPRYLFSLKFSFETEPSLPFAPSELAANRAVTHPRVPPRSVLRKPMMTIIASTKNTLEDTIGGSPLQPPIRGLDKGFARLGWCLSKGEAGS